MIENMHCLKEKNGFIFSVDFCLQTYFFYANLSPVFQIQLL